MDHIYAMLKDIREKQKPKIRETVSKLKSRFLI